MNQAAHHWKGRGEGLKRLFGRFDRDKNNIPDSEEFDRLVKRLLPEATELDVDIVQKALDPDG